MSRTSKAEGTRNPRVTWFAVLMVLALGLGAYAMFVGGGEGNHVRLNWPVEDWISWARSDLTDAGILALAVI
ncbi:MAG: hypothetical protein ACXU8O_05920, partial [Asticcacaulis sp.]